MDAYIGLLMDYGFSAYLLRFVTFRQKVSNESTSPSRRELISYLYTGRRDLVSNESTSPSRRELSLSPTSPRCKKGSYEQPTYEVEGELLWLLTQKIVNSDHREALKKLVKALTCFAMLLGGFGKSWRRADHRLFFPEYYPNFFNDTGEDKKPLIGCHWQWLGERALFRDVRVRKLETLGRFIDEVRQTAEEWMRLRGVVPSQRTPWREAWHPETVQVWGRLADEAEDCEAIRWLHGRYREAIHSVGISEGSINRSSVTGQVGQIGRLRHRMYPLVRLGKNPKNPNGKSILKQTNQYFELLTLLPDDSLESDELLKFLQSEQKMFQRLWPN